MLLFFTLIAFTSGFLLNPLHYQKTTSYLDETVSVYEDSFESDSNWSVYEEIVNSNPCYGSGIGSVSRDTSVSFEGNYSLGVWANEASSPFSNHLIAYKEISTVTRFGNWNYVIRALIDPATEASGQTGPEFSMQNTRLVGVNDYKTSTSGIQYLANPFDPNYQNWYVWHEISPGVAGWTPFTTEGLTSGSWYTLTLEVDYNSNYYQSFTLEGNGLYKTYDLSSYKIAEESKFTEEAFVITLESENLWNNCGTAGEFDYLVFYDNVLLEQSIFNLYLPVVLGSFQK